MELGTKIKKLRTDQNRSLTEIAAACGFTKSLLSKIENGKTVPPIATLEKIADALGTKVAALLNDRMQSGTIMVKAEQPRDNLVQTDKGYSFFAFAVERSEKLMQPYLFVAHKDEPQGNAYTHAGEEFIYILEGEMRYKVGDVEYTLRAGDSLYFDSVEVHSLTPVTDEVKYLGVFAK
ncbi:MAG: helix-turn-helix transcriptional regulator [Paenibacillaceae bacterium]|nr:helix-turn-helix transcriptional regulator [Paenibacillaceae bacterium]